MYSRRYRYYKKYNRYGRRRRYRKRRRGLSLRKLNWKINTVAKNVRPELKHYDTDLSGNYVNVDSFVQGLTAIGQGDTDVLRDGTKIMIKSLQIRFALSATSDITELESCRLVLVKTNWNNATEVAPTWANVFKETNVNSLREIDGQRSQQFQVLWDRTFKLMYDTDGTMRNRVDTKIFKRFNHECTFDGSATIPQTGGLWLMGVGTLSTGLTYIPINGYARVRFTDS